ncbi:MAG: cytochrome c [Myxococcota bacterium]
MSPKGYFGLVLAVAALAAGCTRKSFSEPLKLADKVDAEGNAVPNSGEVLSAQLLTDGYEAYMMYCYACHGEKGDGHGPSAATMRPPPRNFGRGLFKFPGTAFGQLPVDAALDRTLRRGLHGTPMLPWDIPAVERKALIAYLKTLSPRWTEEGVPPEIQIAPDPWAGKKDEAIALGSRVYHVAVGGAGCSGCHRAYETKQKIYEMSLQADPTSPVTEFSEEMYRSSLKASEYPIAYDEAGEPTKTHQLLPPDFLFHPVKTAYPVGTEVNEGDYNYVAYTEAMQREDLYRTIGVGIGGAAMPGWKGVLEEDKLWALVYYVQSLVQLRGTDGAYELQKKLEAQPPFAPPAPPPAPEGAPAPTP